ncbi:MAG: M20/M25/M40 family metallo-hydrolase [Bacillota bacterium]|jgi:tripeptide aminopeptidase
MMIDQKMLAQLQAYYQTHLEDIIAENIAICQVAAPPFQEMERARYVARRLQEAGAENVTVDETPNVYAQISGQHPGPTLMVVAHLDTVFPAETDVTVRQVGNELHAPGVWDDSAALAGLIQLVKGLRMLGTPLRGRLLIVATAGEEGLGDLRGMKQAIKRFGSETDMVIAIDTQYGMITHSGIASRRLRVEVAAEGGHSWEDFGAASAIHAMGHMISEIARLEVPSSPRTSYNVGVVSGGTSVNTIASHAEMLIDMRSTDAGSLADLERRVRAILLRHGRLRDGEQCSREQGRDQTDCGEQDHGRMLRDLVEVDIKVVGDRPGGSIAADHPLVQACHEVLTALQVNPIYKEGSTDANVPLSQNIPAVCIGITEGFGAHRTDEYLDVRYFPDGMAQLHMLVARLLG